MHAARLVGLGALAFASQAMAQWSLARIADTTTIAPGGPVFSSTTSVPFRSASLGRDGQVAFFGRHPGPNGFGIFRGGSLGLIRIADQTTAVPGIPNATFNQGFGGMSYDGSFVAFDATSSIAQTGIFRSTGGSLETLVNNQTSIPGGTGTFSLPSSPSTDNGAISFYGFSQSTVLGFYRWNNGSVNSIVTNTTPIPNGAGNFTNWGNQALAANRLVFGAWNASQSGLYSRDASGTGPISVIIDTSTPVPGLPGQTFAGAGSLSAQDDSIAFTGGTGTVGGVYAYLNNEVIRIVDYNTLGPSGETFTQFNSVAVSGSNVAFVALSSIGPELLVWRNGSLSRIAKIGDVIGGITINTISITSEALRGDTIAFTFQTQLDGASPILGGVYTATFIPAPASAFILVAPLAPLSRRRRR